MAGIQVGPFKPGNFNATLNDNDGVPSEDLDATLAFTIDVDWTIDKNLAKILTTGSVWTAAVYAESLGGGFEGEIGRTTVNQVNAQTAYAGTVTVAANTLPATPASPLSGVYKLVVVLTYDAGGGITRLAGFVELSAVRIA